MKRIALSFLLAAGLLSALPGHAQSSPRKGSPKKVSAGKSPKPPADSSARPDYGYGVKMGPTEEAPVTVERVFEQVDVPAEFPGGAESWSSYVVRGLNAMVPFDNGAPVGRYVVNVRFVVGKDGALSGIKALNDPGYGMAQEAERFLKRGPEWKPARNGGVAVKAYHSVSVPFLVSE